MVGKTEYLEAKLRLQEERMQKTLDEIAMAKAIEAQFGSNDDYKNLTVLRWDQKFDHNGLTYSFVAIKCVGHWYTSGIFQNVKMTWENLVEKHLSKAVEGSVFKMRKGKEIA